MIYFFEDYALNTERRELSHSTKPVPVEPRVFDLLVYLVSNRQRVVSKDDVIAAVWDGRIVSDSAVSSKISAVRQAIGDSAGEQRLIKTLPRKGIRFVAAVSERQGPAAVDCFPETEMTKTPRDSDRDSAALSLPDRPSIAVLPFTNIGGVAEQEHIADGFVEDITTELSRFRDLFVVARNSSFQYKDRAIDVRQIGRELGVRYVLEGSIRREHDRFRISAQLIDSITGAHRWAERYDRKGKNVFAVQDEVARTVAALLAAHVSKAEVERTLLKPPASLQAYDYYMRAAETYATFHRAMQVAAIYETRRLLEQCLAMDPGYARAHVLYSRTKISTWVLRLDDDHLNPLAFEEAHRSAEKAVQLDPNLPEAHANLGYVLCLGGLPDAVSEFERAKELNPNFTDYRFSFALTVAGQGERDVEVAKANLRVDPFALPIARGYLGLAYVFLRKYSEATPPLRDFVAQSPNHRPGRVWLAVAYAHLGQLDEAREQVAHILRLDPDFVVAQTFRRMAAHWPPEHIEQFVDGLRKAGFPVK